MWNVNMKYPPVIIPPVDHSSWRIVGRTAVSWAALTLGLSERIELQILVGYVRGRMDYDTVQLAGSVPSFRMIRLPLSSGLKCLRPGCSGSKKCRVAVSHWEPRSDVSNPEDEGSEFLWNSYITGNTDVAEIGRHVLWLSSVSEISVFVQGSRDFNVARTPIQGSEQLETFTEIKNTNAYAITKTEDDKNCSVYVLVAPVLLPFVWRVVAVRTLYQFSSLFNFRTVIFGLTPSDWLRTRTYPAV
jgi:hypothetical protein